MKKIFYLFIACFTIVGCNKDTINLSNPASFTPQQFYKTQSDMNAAVVGAYGTLRSMFSSTFYYWGECRSDNTGFFNPSSDKNNVNLFMPLAINMAAVDQVWDAAYATIIAANTVLEHVNGATYTDPDLKSQYTGEAYLIRALAYFYLARLYGGTALNGQVLGVPLVVGQLGAQEARTLPRASLADTYGLIVSDLTAAKADLPASQTGVNAGRFTSVAAQALLGKVYMFMAGFPLNLGATYYAKAVTEFEPVIQNPAYSLVPSYIQLFNSSNKNSSEALIEIQFKSSLTYGTGNSFQSQMLTSAGASALVPAGDAGSSDNKPEPSILNAYAPGDPRKSVTFRPGYQVANGSYATEAYGHKYWQELGQNISDVDAYYDWNCNWKELRLAEVYLLYAEAQVRSGGDLNQALLYLNMVRERARNTNEAEDPTIGTIEAQFPTWNPGDPSVTLADYTLADFATTADMLQAIENESRVEFALENKRWFTLVRLQQAPAVMTAELAADENVNITWNDRDYALPIPQDAMQDDQPNTLIQNIGYAQF